MKYLLMLRRSKAGNALFWSRVESCDYWLHGVVISLSLSEAVERPKEEKDQKADKHKKSAKDDKSAKVNLQHESNNRPGSSFDSFAM